MYVYLNHLIQNSWQILNTVKSLQSWNLPTIDNQKFTFLPFNLTKDFISFLYTSRRKKCRKLQSAHSGYLMLLPSVTGLLQRVTETWKWLTESCDISFLSSPTSRWMSSRLSASSMLVLRLWNLDRLERHFFFTTSSQVEQNHIHSAVLG